MPSQRPEVRRFDLSDPDTIAPMLRSGAIWSNPQFWQSAVKAIEKGVVPLDECKNVPPQIIELLSR